MTDTSLMEEYELAFADLLSMPVYSLNQAEKRQQLSTLFQLLHQHHLSHCPEYKRIFGGEKNEKRQTRFNCLEDIPFLAVRLFKQLELRSVPASEVFKTLQSSGTTGAQVAKIFLDKATSRRQSQVLVKIMQQSIGKQRLPMLIIDSPDVLKDKSKFSARGAGIQGMAFFGRDHCYALDQNMQPDWPSIDAFVEKYANQPVLIFGFTFMVWLYFIETLNKLGKTLPLPQGMLVHSGGWKKLIDQQVDNATFKQRLHTATGITQCFNFYGMAEQVGSVFVECAAGHLHTPIFAEVIVRDPYSLRPLKPGETGLIQVLSVLPTSYPGHSLLTEDMGTIIGEDDCPCGQKGRYFAIQGRLPKTEVRGCSDTHGESL